MASFLPLIAASQFSSSFQFRLALIPWDLPDRHHASQCSRICSTLGHNLRVRCTPLLCSITSKAWTSESEMPGVPGQPRTKLVGFKHEQGWTSAKWPRWAGAGEFRENAIPLHPLVLSTGQSKIKAKQMLTVRGPKISLRLAGKGKLQILHTPVWVKALVSQGTPRCSSQNPLTNPQCTQKKHDPGCPCHNFAC